MFHILRSPVVLQLGSQPTETAPHLPAASSAWFGVVLPCWTWFCRIACARPFIFWRSFIGRHDWTTFAISGQKSSAPRKYSISASGGAVAPDTDWRSFWIVKDAENERHLEWLDSQRPSSHRTWYLHLPQGSAKMWISWGLGNA
jgi:hypothetical protein